MKNLSEILPAETAGAATRWELPLFAAGAMADHTVIGAQLHTAEHLDALEQSAYQEGLQRGHADGYAAGLRAGQAKVQEQIQRLGDLLDGFARPFEALSADIEHSLVALAMDAARKLVNAELALDPAKVAGAVHEAVASLASAPRELRVHLHPEDVQLLRDTLTLNTEAEWKLVPDNTLSRGDCLLMTDAGRVDARLETRQAGLQRGLMGEDA
ncbi:MAG: flagellar assembly protein FliH [Nevskiaceae bacterium]|nr:MAG: flagellar assembly protein FliH [Nevskiaceae bacterium]